MLNNTISNSGYWQYGGSSSSTVGGLKIDGYTRAIVNYNNFSDNNYAIVNNVPASVVSEQDAKFNYWGTATTTEITTGANPKNLTKVYDQYDDNTLGFVNYGQSFLGLITSDTVSYTHLTLPTTLQV